MANVLDLRRRIRSVKNTRQITKAMKMVVGGQAAPRAGARHLRAALRAMLASVVDSLMRRIDLIDPRTGELRHPLLMTREEKRVLLIVVSGDKGFAGAFNANIIKAASISSLRMPTSRSTSSHRPQRPRSFPPPLSGGKICRSRPPEQGAEGAKTARPERQSARAHRSHRRPSRHARESELRPRARTRAKRSSPATSTRRSTPPTLSTTNSNP